jgi:hypothetical protein
MLRLAPSKSPALSLLLLAAAAALVVTTVALEAWLDTGWTQSTAAASLGATVLAAAVLLSTAQGWENGARVSLAALATAVVGLGALALVIVTYVGGAGDAGLSGDSSAAIQQVSEEGAALSRQVSNNEQLPPGYAHDMGVHPTFSGFMAMDDAAVLAQVPGGSLVPDEVPLVKDQLAEARAFAETVNTFEKATAGGYYNTTNDVPYMGAHFINSGYLTDGVFDPSKPEGLLFSKLGEGSDAEWQLVGVWYLIIPGLNPGVTSTIPPEGFAGNLDLWHEHYGLCTRAGIISENNTSDGCAADHGNFIGDLRWMMHVWVWPETADNPEGVFTYLNENLFQKQQRVQAEP